ncbi:MAG: hypothetical protein ACTSU3_05100 [Candidatus Thorarchaeota archaeon]
MSKDPWKKAVRKKSKDSSKHGDEDDRIERQPHNIQSIVIRVIVDPAFLESMIAAQNLGGSAMKELLSENGYLAALTDNEAEYLVKILMSKVKWKDVKNLRVHEIKDDLLDKLGIKSRFKGIIIDSWLLGGP